nr:MAG TPA: hypothetical protein [Caudoviricetes sp.]
MGDFTKQQVVKLLAISILALIVAIAIFVVATGFVIANGNSKGVSAAYAISVPMLVLSGLFSYALLKEVTL